MIFINGTKVKVAKGAVAIKYNFDGHEIDVEAEPIENDFYGFTVGFDHRMELRDPAVNTKVVDIATGKSYLFTDHIADKYITNA